MKMWKRINNVSHYWIQIEDRYRIGFCDFIAIK